MIVRIALEKTDFDYATAVEWAIENGMDPARVIDTYVDFDRQLITFWQMVEDIPAKDKERPRVPAGISLAGATKDFKIDAVGVVDDAAEGAMLSVRRQLPLITNPPEHIIEGGHTDYAQVQGDMYADMIRGELRVLEQQQAAKTAAAVEGGE